MKDFLPLQFKTQLVFDCSISHNVLALPNRTNVLPSAFLKKSSREILSALIIL